MILYQKHIFSRFKAIHVRSPLLTYSFYKFFLFNILITLFCRSFGQYISKQNICSFLVSLISNWLHFYIDYNLQNPYNNFKYIFDLIWGFFLLFFFFVAIVCTDKQYISNKVCIDCPGHCKENAPCNKLTGMCDNGCANQWTGAFCNSMLLLLFQNYVIEL